MQSIKGQQTLWARHAAKWRVSSILVLSDLCAAILFLSLGIYLREALLPALFDIRPFSPVRAYASLWPVLGLFILLRAFLGLYPGYGLNPAEDLRRQTLSSGLLLFFVLAGGALFRFSEDYSRIVLGLSGLMLVFGLPFVRVAVKYWLAKTELYGEAVYIIGETARCDELAEILSKKPLLGLRVVGRGPVPKRATQADICLLVPDALSPEALTRLLDQLNRQFERVWLVPNLLDVASVWVTPRDLEGHLALELQNNLLSRSNQLLKRVLDITLVALSLPLVLPLLLLCALWVRLDSQGPVLFSQTRLGRGGEPFTLRKFRSMHCNADEALERHFASHPEAKAEWAETRKLVRDPRITRSGRFLRRSSLDELPQLWNVLRGNMSLVGPRPVVEGELDWYGEKAHLYKQVVPGLTGLFQVSGRNHLSYAERVHLDAYYVRNWSMWLDLVILSQTLAVVLSGDGAY